MLTLEVYYRYLPLYQPSDTDPLHGKEEGAAAEPRQAANPPQGTLRPLPAQPEP